MRSLLQSLSGNRFKKIQGIVNGTCNYILTKMEDEGSEFDKTLKVAQELGYAEADAELDVGGIDAAHKCAILASLAFGQDIRFADVYREGIRSIDPLDFEIANDYGMKIKLIATAEQLKWGAVLARVHPAMLPKSSMLTGVSGVYNAAIVEGVPMGQYFFHGEGAGPGSTASGVIGDVVAMAAAMANSKRTDFQLLPVPSGVKDVAPMAAWEGRYYMRVKSTDVKGSLASLVFGLEQNAIPIREVGETEVKQGRRKTSWLILMTKMTSEASLQSALQKLQESGILKKSPTVIRIEE
jgi:homoserine dehydrogenase